jgi:NAD(P)-dependent dehydrogenase (short-subunit alcohol dehydrogenase family)
LSGPQPQLSTGVPRLTSYSHYLHLPSPFVLITGANQGIGQATAKNLASQYNYHVLIGCRRIEAGEKVASELRAAGHKATSLQLDLDSEESIKAAVDIIEKDYGYLDILMNNAAVLLDHDNTLSPWALYSRTFTPNVIGTATLTHLLLPLIRKAKATPPTIIFVSSGMGSLTYGFDKSVPFHQADNRAYNSSKAAVNLLVANYKRILEPKGGKVNAVSPGLVATNMTAHMNARATAEVGAASIVQLSAAGKDGESGTFTNRDGVVLW